MGVAPQHTRAHPYHPQWIPKCQHANYVQDGGSIMTRSCHVQFIARTLLQLVLFFLAQLPTAYQVRVDSEHFFSAISYSNDDGERETVSPWPTGPGWGANRENEETTSTSREEVWAKLKKFVPHVARTIPSVVIAYAGDSEKILLGGGGSLCVKHVLKLRN